jgi:hypothetical protein
VQVPSRRYGRRLFSPQENSKIAEMEKPFFALFTFLRGKKFIRVHQCPSVVKLGFPSR